MNLFLLTPTCTAVILALHIWLRLTNRGQHRLTFGLLMAGLTVIAVIPFYWPGLLNPDLPPTSGFVDGINRRALVPALFAIEVAGLLMVAVLVETVFFISRKHALTDSLPSTRPEDQAE